MFDPTPFIVMAVLILISVPVTVAVIRNVRKQKALSAPKISAKPQAPVSVSAGTQLIHGHYEFKSPPFKQGGMATIWMAKDRDNGKLYIVKTPRRGTTMDNIYMDKLMLEADYLKRLKHPNIVKYINDFYADGEFHLVLEYISGETMMSSPPRTSPGEQKVVAWACQLLNALSYVHAAGIIHRDINPKNIILCSDETIRLIDFGTARDLRDTSKKDDTPRDPFTQIANKGFDIPELFMGGESDQRCDLCGVAQTCTYLLTLRQPNELCSTLIGSNWPRTFGEAKILADHLISTGLSARTARCLAQASMFAPEKRFSSAQAMSEALCAAATDHSKSEVAAKK